MNLSNTNVPKNAPSSRLICLLLLLVLSSPAGHLAASSAPWASLPLPASPDHLREASSASASSSALSATFLQSAGPGALRTDPVPRGPLQFPSGARGGAPEPRLAPAARSGSPHSSLLPASLNWAFSF